MSRYCNRKVVELLNANDSALSRPGAALAEAFVEADACLEREHRDWTDNGGSTAVAVLMPNCIDFVTLWLGVAKVGAVSALLAKGCFYLRLRPLNVLLSHHVPLL